MRATFCLTLLLALTTVGCGPDIDLKTALKVDDVSTGWYDLGVVNGQTKLVPSVAFTFKNASGQAISTLQGNVIFRRVGESEEWGSGFIKVTGSEGLAPGASTGRLFVKSQLGYTGSDQTRKQMLDNSSFVDARVQIFAKYGSTQWTLIAEHPVDRRLVDK